MSEPKEYELCEFGSERDFTIGLRLRAESGWLLHSWIRRDWLHDEGRIQSWEATYTVIFERERIVTLSAKGGNADGPTLR